MSSGLFIPLGAAILALGLFVLLRPGAARSLLGMRAGDAATYSLRIAGMMLAALGLILGGFAIAYRLSAPLGATSSQGAD